MKFTSTIFMDNNVDKLEWKNIIENVKEEKKESKESRSSKS